MAWKPRKDIEERNKRIKRDFEKGMTREELASKYRLSCVSIGNILREDKEVKSHEDRVNNYVPVEVKPGQTIKLRVNTGERRKVRKFKVLHRYKHIVLMESNGIKESFTDFDIWKNIVK